MTFRSPSIGSSSWKSGIARPDPADFTRKEAFKPVFDDDFQGFRWRIKELPWSDPGNGSYVPSEVPFKSSTTQLLVYLPSVACFYDQNPHNAILNFAEHSIVSNPISPQFPKGAG
jgi:hypothetical protein